MVMMFVLRAMLMSGIMLKIAFVLMTLFLLKTWVMPIVMGTHAFSPSKLRQLMTEKPSIRDVAPVLMVSHNHAY
ncbi:hypothetical protein KCO_15077 [Pectobacterium brasiliense ICMP 19477]|nr:hypothetical protein KCO_15077 [Pectobacterium brasiliense ICMP 19477]